MKYILLVAGKARRLEPLTYDVPKCLFNLGKGVTVINRLISQINTFDTHADIILVTGFKHNLVEEVVTNDGVTTIFNPFYDISNNIASLWFAKDHLEGDVVIISGDFILCDKIVSEILCVPPNQSQVLIDSSVKDDGDYNVCIDGDRVVVMGKKLEHYDGEWVGINMISRSDIDAFKDTLCRMIDNGRHDQWHADVLSQMIFEDDFRLGYKDVAEYEWTDIDTVDDLRLAKQIVQNGLCKEESVQDIVRNVSGTPMYSDN